MADQIVQAIVDWVQMVPPSGIYLILFGIAYLENVIPPIPGDVIVAFGGYLAAEGVIGIFPLWIITVIASVVGFMNMYWLGSRWGTQIEDNREDHFLLRFIDYKYFKRGKKWMKDWGQGVVIANRFLAGTRSVIALTAGVSHLRIPRTMLSSALSSVLWNTLLIGAGWIIQDNWRVVGTYLSNYGKIILAALIVLIGLKLWFRRRNKAQEAAGEK
ncbi:DedA family protein [Balneola sp. MJW-20]|uniref:DedA family protein n=1 Tax=Gracilimonas aurantiaca TaxID=3234185 RepID=UPI00346643BD